MKKILGIVREFIRKRLVGLKRKPQIIALLTLLAAFVYYSFNLTHISNTTASINYPGMGLSAFVIMLFSILSMVCFLNAFPRRKKANIPMLVLMFAMIVGVAGCSFYYESQIDLKIVNTREQFLVAAQGNVRDANKGVAAAPASIAAAEKSVAAAQRAAKVTEDAQAALDAALKGATIEQAAYDTAKKAVDAAASSAAKAVTSAQKALENAKSFAEEAKTKAEAAPNSADLAAVNKTARDAINVANKVANNVTTAAKAAEDAEAARVKAMDALSAAGVTLTVTDEGETASQETAAAEAPEVELPEAIVNEALAQGETKVNELLGTAEKPTSVSRAKSVLQVHRIILLAAVILTVLLPVYAPLIRKIRTSIEVEANENMGAIELDGSAE